MIEVRSEYYAEMLGTIDPDAMCASVKCMAQCTGCMCNCRCSCSGSGVSELEWEEL